MKKVYFLVLFIIGLCNSEETKQHSISLGYKSSKGAFSYSLIDRQHQYSIGFSHIAFNASGDYEFDPVLSYQYAFLINRPSPYISIGAMPRFSNLNNQPLGSIVFGIGYMVKFEPIQFEIESNYLTTVDFNNDFSGDWIVIGASLSYLF